MKTACVIAITATYRRPTELARLLASLATIPTQLGGAIVIDNGAGEASSSEMQTGPLSIHRIAPGENLGCGGGLRLGEQMALERFPSATHFWILDDDAVVEPATLSQLLGAMATEKADAAHPLVVAPDGSLGWFPGLLDRKKFRTIKKRQTPDEFVAQCGDAPIPFSWSQGIALLVTRSIVDRVGFHRDDFWVRGEDLEFSLRITAIARGIYVPAARVAHLPPSALGTDAGDSEYAKHRAMLQNLAYTAVRLPHGRRLVRTLPGNWLRFLRTWPRSLRTVKDLIDVAWLGALLGRPAGAQPGKCAKSPIL
jgi:GT2 family glycosyltransferase